MNTEMKYNGQRIFNGTVGPPMSHSASSNKVFSASSSSSATTSELHHPSTHHSIAGTLESIGRSSSSAGPSNQPASRLHHYPPNHFSMLPQNHAPMSKGLYRINSALDLDHNELDAGLRREFGSVSSIDALGNNNASDTSFYSLLKQLKRDQNHPSNPSANASVANQSAFAGCSSTISTSMQSNVAQSNALILPNDEMQAYSAGLANSTQALDTDGVSSPRVRKRLPKLWEKDKSKSKNVSSLASTSNGGNSNNNNNSNNNTGASSTNVAKDSCDLSLSTKAIFRKFTRLAKNHQSNADSDANDDCSARSNPLSVSTQRLDDPEVRFEEKLRRKAFAHYDCQSLTANLSTASRLCHLLSKRRNTTTGASAASMGSKPNLTATGSAPTTCTENETAPMDAGDDRSNDLLLSCPFFRNELGGEEERQVALSRYTADRSSSSNQPVLHRPHMSAGLALLEDANERRWKLKCCPYQRTMWPMMAGGSVGSAAGTSLSMFGMSPAANAQLERSFAIEHCDVGATYYRQHFYGLEHQNWFGIDEHLGPVAISIRRERVPVEYNSDGNASTANNQPANGQAPPTKNQYRLIIRTSELCVLRGAVHEDALPFLHGNNQSRHSGNQLSNHHAKEVLEYIAPELMLSSLRLGVSSADEQLLKLDEQLLTRTYKVGVLYCRAGQRSEEEMYNNEHGSGSLDAFLDCIGQRVRLNGFDKYRAGLDNKSDTTGTHSLYATFADSEIMFHVSTMLPYTPNNRQQLLRKRHIGNDIVTIVFQEHDAPPFTPKCIRSHFQHVFIVIRQLMPFQHGSPIRYAVAVTRSKDVPVFGPPLPPGGQFTRGRAFAQFLLAKVINAENAAHRSEKFKQMAQRTRHEYLKEMATAQCTNTTLQEASGSGGSAGAKLVSSIFGGARKNRIARAGRDCQFVGHSAIKGAICWEMCVEDFGQSRPVDCIVAVSSDTLLLLEQQTQQVIFVCGCQSILGWSSYPNWIKIFFHQGEFLLIRCKDPDLDEIGELVTRLRAVTTGCETQDIILRRNNVGQLGFHVGYDGVVSHVEQFAYAWQAGLRRSARIVEICKVAIATLSYEQMLDLLKTSITVSVTVLPPLAENCPRRGCNLTNCPYVTNPLTCSTNSSYGSDYENVGSSFDKMMRPGQLSQPKSSTSSAPAGAAVVCGSPASSGSASKSLPVSPDQSCKIPLSSLHTSSSAYSNLALSSGRSLHNGSPYTTSSWNNGSSIGNTGTYPGSSSSHAFNGTSSLPLSHKEPHPSVNKLHGAALSLSTGSSASTVSGNQMLAAAHISSAIGAPTGYTYAALSRSKTMLSNNGKPSSAMALAGNRSPYSKGAGLAMVAASNLAASIHEGLHCIGQTQSISQYSNAGRGNTMAVGQSSTLPQQPKSNKATSDYNSDTSSSNEWNSNSWSLPHMTSKASSGLTNNNTTSNSSSLVQAMSSNLSSSSKSTTPCNSQTNTLDSAKKSTVSNSSNRSNSNAAVMRNGFARLKASHPNSTAGSSCCSSSTSTLQEDLLRLISPEFMVGNSGDLNDNETGHETTESPNTNGSGSGDCSTSTQYSTPYSSLERDSSCGRLDTADEASPTPASTSEDKQTNASSSSANQKSAGNQIILTVAQPAQVVSESINGATSVKVTCNSSPDSTESSGQEKEWRNLVETAQKALSEMSSSGDNNDRPSAESIALSSGSSGAIDSLDDWIREFEHFSKQQTNSIGSASSSSQTNASKASLSGLDFDSVKQLGDQLKRLQIDLVKEQSDKLTLEEQVKRLRLENARLHEESQTAAAQLRKFTELFFQNINAK